MLLSTNIDAFLKHFECEEVIEIISKAGFDALDFSFFDEKFYGKETDSEAFKVYFMNLRKLAQEKGMCFNQAHAPMPCSKEDEEWTESRFYDIVRAMRNASYLGVPIIVLHSKTHLKYVEAGNPEKGFKMSMNFFKRLIPYCEKYNIKIAIENQYQNSGNNIVGIVKSHGYTSKPERLINYVDSLNSEWVVACLDIGHAFLVREEPADFIRALGSKRLKALHVHDVDGTKDSHTLPYYGIIDWDRTSTALKEIGYEGDFTLEAPGFLTNLPKELIPEATCFMARVGRHVMSKII